MGPYQVGGGVFLFDPFKERVERALTMPQGKATYVPGDEIEGEELRSFSDKPILSPPLVCQLCEAGFLTESAFTDHKKHEHGGDNEYRKRVLFLMAEAGHRPITAQEKRIMVQNFAHFQQYCHPGAQGNYFADGEAVPRQEAACAICAQKDFLEHRHKLCLFGDVPAAGAIQPDAEQEDEEAEEQEAEQHGWRRATTPAAASYIKHKGAYYIQSPEKVQQLLNVERYAERWPLIPVQELHASSVRHPNEKGWRWLLHSRRVPLTQEAEPTGGVLQPADMAEAPMSAGVGDPEGFVWACWDCTSSLCRKKPEMPLNALANDNWIGREREHVRSASKGTKMLSSLARCCWKQVRLGKGSPEVQQKAINGNTIFFAQPTADIPSMELPPPSDALADSFNVVFTRSVSDLSKAEWAVVDREAYLRIVQERKEQCATYAHVHINEEAAATRLPENGVSSHRTTPALSHIREQVLKECNTLKAPAACTTIKAHIDRAPPKEPGRPSGPFGRSAFEGHSLLGSVALICGCVGGVGRMGGVG